MRFRNIENWTDPDRDRNLLFFAQRIDELTFNYTIDSHRAPTMCPPSIVREILDYINLTGEIRGGEKALQHILEELEFRLRSNPIVKRLLNIRLDTHLAFDRSNQSEIQRSLRVLSREISPTSYALACFEEASEACRGNSKDKIDFACSEIISTLTSHGVSSIQINKSIIDIFYSKKIVDGPSCLDEFFKRIFPTNHKFDVLLIMETPIKISNDRILDAMKIKFSQEIPEKFLEARKTGYKKIRGDEIYVCINDVTAPDKYSSIDKAKGRSQRLHDLFGIFFHKDTFRLADEAYALQLCCSKKVFSLKTSSNLMQFTVDNPPKKAATKLARLVQQNKFPYGSDREKFFSVAAFHGMSINSSSPESQLVQIWTALETMCPQNKNFSIVESVSNNCISIIGLSYARKLFLNLTFDYIRWDRHRLAKALNRIETDEDMDLVEKVYCLVSLEKNQDALEELFTDLKNFELLRYRTYKLRNKFGSPSSFISSIKTHTKKVKWQFHRIYRARNAIVHLGESLDRKSGLLFNSHDYFDKVLRYAILSVVAQGAMTTIKMLSIFQKNYSSSI